MKEYTVSIPVRVWETDSTDRPSSDSFIRIVLLALDAQDAQLRMQEALYNVVNPIHRLRRP